MIDPGQTKTQKKDSSAMTKKMETTMSPDKASNFSNSLKKMEECLTTESKR